MALRKFATMIFIVALLLVGCGGVTMSVEEGRSGNTFTLVGHCKESTWSSCDKGDRLVTMKNRVARMAGTVCARHGLSTAQVAKLGDQRVVVICVRH